MARVLYALALALVPSLALAVDNPELAREHYHQGSKLFDLRRFHQAAKEFEAAYEAKDDPLLLYNIAQAYRLAGENSEAVGAYRSYLRRNPKAPNRAEVLARIAELQQLIDQQHRTQDSQPTGVLPPAHEPAPTPEHPPTVGNGNRNGTGNGGAAAKASDQPHPGRSLEIAGGVIAAVGLACAAASIAFTLLAASAFDKLNNPTPGQVFDPALESTGQTDQTLAIALGAGAVAAVVVGTALFAVGWRDAHRAHVALVPARGGALLTAEVRW